MSEWKGAESHQRAGRSDSRYLKAVEDVAIRALEGEPCWFQQLGKCRYPGVGFEWNEHLSALAFTAHHIDRVMDGGAAVVDGDKLVPAHRGCNSADGLRAQNRRRAARKAGMEYVPEPEEQAITSALSASMSPTLIAFTEPTSRDW